MEAFKQFLLEELENKTAFTLDWFGGIAISQAVVVTWIIMAIWMVITLFVTRNLKVRNPGKLQVALESCVTFLNGFVKDNTGVPLHRTWGQLPCILGCPM